MEPTKTRVPTWFKKHRVLAFSALVGVVFVLGSGVVIAKSHLDFGNSCPGLQVPKPQKDIQIITTAIKLFHLEANRFPNERRWMEELTTKTDTHKRHMDRIPKDPWGNEYQYRWIGRQQQGFPDIWSSGPDEISGTEDDIANWVTEAERLAGDKP